MANIIRVYRRKEREDRIAEQSLLSGFSWTEARDLDFREEFDAKTEQLIRGKE